MADINWGTAGPGGTSVPPLSPGLGTLPQNNGFNWQSLIPSVIGAGASLGGQVFQTSQANKMAQAQLAQQQAQFNTTTGLKESEMARRNQISQAVAPALLHNLGYTDPAQIAALQKQFGTQPTAAMGAPGGSLGGGSQLSGSGQNGQYQMAPVQGSKAATGIGLAGGLGGLAAGAAFGGPVGAAVAGAGMLGSAIASKVGQGRKAANSFVQGVEDPFGKEDLPKVVAMKDSGNIEGAKALFNDAYSAYKEAVQAAIQQGGKDALVAQQSLQNSKLQDTIKTIAQQLGVSV